MKSKLAFFILLAFASIGVSIAQKPVKKNAFGRKNIHHRKLHQYA